MGWSGSLTVSSAVGTSITFTPDEDEKKYPINTSTYVGTYTVSSFTAPKKGIYRFQLYGSGGAQRMATTGYAGAHGGEKGGSGGYTDGYLLLEAGQTVYVGAGGLCCAAFVSVVNGENLASIAQESLLFVAGAGGSGGGYHDWNNSTGYGCTCRAGTNGGGATGESVTEATGTLGFPGTQEAGGVTVGAGSKAGAYGVGGNGRAWSDTNGGKYACFAGRGGDGYYGGSGGTGSTSTVGLHSYGGGGGSGYVKTEVLTTASKTFISLTSQGGGADSNTNGSAIVTYYARAELPVVYNGTKLTKIIYNGTEITSLIYNGTKLF